MTPLISHALVEVLRCNPAEHPILVTEPAWNTPTNRERMAEIVFEEFNAPAFYIANTGVLNAYVRLLMLFWSGTGCSGVAQIRSRERYSTGY
jgi:actin-related protein